MDILIKALQLILSLSILVIFHEFGHFFFAKLFKTRVEKFYLFFNPWFSLFKYKHKETEYGVGWIPLGGYVKISGMIDESMDKEQLKKPAQPWEFRSKKPYQRLLIMVGGVLVNILLAMAIYIMILFVWGREYLPTENAKYGIVCDSLALDIGLQHGDKVVSIDNQKVEDFNELTLHIILNQSGSIQVNREGEELNIPVPKSTISQLLQIKKEKKRIQFIELAFPFVINEFSDDSNAKKAGIQKDDKIIGFNNQVIPYFSLFPLALENYKGKTINIQLERDGEILTVPTQVNKDGYIGVRPYVPGEDYFSFEFKTETYSIFEAIPKGIAMGYREIGRYIQQLKLIFNPETGAYKSVGSFLTIGSIFPDSWIWHQFWKLTALLSIMLAIINILPIPALDGGHVMFLAYEMIIGRKPSDKFLEYAQIAGMVVLISLMVFALRNDIINHVF